jgi:hypothetical protein
VHRRAEAASYTTALLADIAFLAGENMSMMMRGTGLWLIRHPAVHIQAGN